MPLRFNSELVDPKPVEPMRRVLIELPESCALALADALDDGITWCETSVTDELTALYLALRGEG